MSIAGLSTGAVAQHRLSGFLRAELLHTLGAYHLSEHRLRALRRRFGSNPGDRVLQEAIEHSALHNKAMREELHKPQLTGHPASRCRHPSPFIDRPKPRPDTELLVAIRSYYETAIEAMGLYLQAIVTGRQATTPGERLGERLAFVHDPQRRESTADPAMVEARLRRTQHRMEKVHELIVLDEEPPPHTATQYATDALIEEHIGHWEPPYEKGEDDGGLPFHQLIVQALGDAHDWMHECEHLHSRAFGEMFPRVREMHDESEAMLKRSIALNTFVYVAARSAPWVFAEDPDERAQVFDDYRHCHSSLTPPYCLWIGSQLSLLALERRAFSWWSMGRHDRAYRDFYKLTRLLKGLRSEVDERATRVPGTKTLIIGLLATAEHHIGRIYRGQHAHRVAVHHFDRASAYLEGWEDHEEIGDILKDSRWRLNLLMSRGKANYELGRMKRSLLSYAEAWRAYLQLVEAESGLTANFKVVEEMIAWLRSVEDEPELSKLELRTRVEPLARQFESMNSPPHLRLLAADIMMRLGHLLYVLKLPPPGWQPADDSPRRPPADYTLARRCMFKAAELDPTSTLIATDLLKIRHGEQLKRRAENGLGGAEQTPHEPDYPSMAPLEQQWPTGGGRFEEAARAIEYVVQTWLDPAEEPGGPRAASTEIARSLLRSFLAHTDSSNVKLAQVYRYLMQKRREVDRDALHSVPAIELICLRRYSSFFPFLPRPAAFRALGGGYLVQIHDPEEERPFGIAIDPGPHFLNNLYRSGYGLADIQMIVATHDHADHIASLDALLALLGYRGLLGDTTFEKDKRLLIVGNDSVVQRYNFYNRNEPVKRDKNHPDKRAARFDSVRVMSFSKFNRITGFTDPERRTRALEEAGIQLTPKSLRIQPVKTIEHFDAAGHVSQGFLLSVGRSAETRSSILFTGDTGRQPKPSALDGKKPSDRYYYAKGGKSLERAAAEADIVVAHLSSVPLPELRNLAGRPAVAEDDELAQTLVRLWKKAEKEAHRSGQGADEAGFLLRQLQFAFRSRGWDESFAISPFHDTRHMRERSEKHLFLSGLLDLADCMVDGHRRDGAQRLMLIGELREELGTFRTRIASHITQSVFAEGKIGTALTTDIGLRLRVFRPSGADAASVSVLCTTCDLDNDLIATERFHPAGQIQEVCVKGENEGVFYNCKVHDPGSQPGLYWVESVERYNVFGD